MTSRESRLAYGHMMILVTTEQCKELTVVHAQVVWSLLNFVQQTLSEALVRI